MVVCVEADVSSGANVKSINVVMVELDVEIVVVLVETVVVIVDV